MITGLHHVAIAVRDFDAAEDGYRRLLGVAPERQDGGGARRAWFRFPNMSLEVIAPDGEAPWAGMVRAQIEAHGEGIWLVAFAVDRLDEAARLAERRGLAVVHRTEGVAAMLDPATLAGIQIVLFGDEARPAPTKGPVAGLDHVVIRTPNVDRAVANFGGRLGLDLRLDRSNDSWGVRQLFFKAGDAVVEFGASLKAPASDAPDSFGGLAWRVTDADAAQATIADAGFDVSEVRTGRKPGTKTFTVRDAPGATPTIMIQQTAQMEAA